MCKKRVLYVEDNKCSQVMVKLALEQKGFRVDVADDVYQGLMRLIYSKYDAIILDYHLPMFTPDEAEHAMRKARVPICYYTCDPEVAQEASRNGIPIINKMDDSRGGLKGLERTLRSIMAEELPEDYDKTRKITVEELEAVRKPSERRPVLFRTTRHPSDGTSETAPGELKHA